MLWSELKYSNSIALTHSLGFSFAKYEPNALAEVFGVFDELELNLGLVPGAEMLLVADGENGRRLANWASMHHRLISYADRCPMVEDEDGGREMHAGDRLQLPRQQHHALQNKLTNQSQILS